MTAAIPPLTAPAARGFHAWRAPAVAFALTGFALAAIQIQVSRPMLLAERFVAGAGWAEALLLSAYAAWLAARMQDPSASPRWRQRVWSLFSAVFFGQLLLGLAGFERLLMSGKLHLPIPALIVAGPLYRGEGLFMPILFLTTLLLVGPAWCSHLCYVGSWDLAFASRRRRPLPLPRWRERARAGVLATVVLAAIGLRLLGASPRVAAGIAIGFALAGVGLMAFVSRRTGSMAHCTLWCPIGLLSVVVGKLSPFRMRIAEGCSRCHACARACRYGALEPIDLERGRPGLSCTLCGDCVSACHSRRIEYRFLGASPARARLAFIVLVASLHAVFLGVARV